MLGCKAVSQQLTGDLPGRGILGLQPGAIAWVLVIGSEESS